MSTDAQLQGDSLRRQLELSERYAAEHDLELDKELSLRDIGVSAFDGSNLQRGELGAFLTAVRTGRVAPGSELLLESFDRLSRGDLQTSITLMMELLNSGITIVTLTDGKRFVPGQTKFEDIILSVVVLSRAHEESVQKSRRLKAVWQNKRAQAGEKKMTARCPGWLRLSPAQNIFEPIPERVELVRRIYDEAIGGIGADSIARRLNREGMKPFGSSNGWQKSSVQKILCNRAVLGEYQPMKMATGKRTPAGEVRVDYFPAIIEKETFYAAQGARASRRVGGGGRKGAKVSNLFSKVARCGYCAGRMHYLNKGAKGGVVLMCDRARRGLSCWAIGWNYRDFETTFLRFVKELDLSEIGGSPIQTSQLADIRADLLATNGKLDVLTIRRDRTYDLLIDSPNPEISLRARFNALEEAIGETEQERKSLIEFEADCIVRQEEFHRSTDSISAAIAILQNDSSDDTFKHRSIAAAKIAALVEEILFFSAGVIRSIEQVKEIERYLVAIGVNASKIDSFRNPGLQDPKGHRGFYVKFRNGSHRFVAPDSSNPSEYKVQAAPGESIYLSPNIEHELRRSLPPAAITANKNVADSES